MSLQARSVAAKAVTSSFKGQINKIWGWGFWIGYVAPRGHVVCIVALSGVFVTGSRVKHSALHGRFIHHTSHDGHQRPCACTTLCVVLFSPLSGTVCDTLLILPSSGAVPFPVARALLRYVYTAAKA